MMDDSKEETKIAEVLKLVQEIASELQNEGMDVSSLRQSSPDKWFSCYSKYLKSKQSNFENAHAVLRIHVGKNRHVEVRYYIQYYRIKQNKKTILNDKMLEKRNEIREYVADKLSDKYHRVDIQRTEWDAFIYQNKSVSYDDLINDPENEKAYLKNALIDMWNDFENMFKVILEPNKEETNVKKEEENMPESRIDILLNQILYGPPGTGKTYNTVNKALEIMNIDIHNKTRKEIKDLFDENINKGRILFTTFHQSMCYEDFIEGIKPILRNDEENSLNYIVEDGLFLRLCTYAKYELYCTQHKQHDAHSITRERLFEIAYDMLLNEIATKLDNESAYELPTKDNYIVQVMQIKDQFNLRLQHKAPNSGKSYTVSKERLLILFLKYESINEIANVHDGITEVLQGGNSSVYWATLNRLINIASTIDKSQINNIESNAPDYETMKTVVADFTITKEDFEKLENTNKINNYVLIIDEINRGNVSQIFGELITLIEEDKRQGKQEALEVTLPYSHNKFSVPPNLYIIGTMNTADRSIEALDTALRRRFSFEEITPRYDLDELKTEIAGVEMHKLLKTINQRIEKLIDKDHMIGHSYLMSIFDVEGLKTVFQNKIIPLLQEYFYGDFGKIGLVIGKGFFENGGTQDNIDDDFFADFDDYPVEELSSRPVYRLHNVIEMSDTEFIQAISTLLKNK